MHLSMKRGPHSVGTSRCPNGVSQQEERPTLQQTLFVDNTKTQLPLTGKMALSSQAGHSFGQPYLYTKCKPKPSTSTDKAGLPKPVQIVWKPRPVINRSLNVDNDDGNELVKYMSNLPTFLQHMENRSNVQDKALNFGVLDWKRLEMWKYNERMPSGKYPQKASSSSSVGIGIDSRNQSSSSHVRDRSSLYSGNQVVFSSRFGLPDEERNVSYNKGDKFAEIVKANKGKETCSQVCQADFGAVGLQGHFHRREKSCEETNVCNSRRKGPKKDIMSREETLQNNSYAEGKRREKRSSDVKLMPECHPTELENIVLLKPNNLKRGCSESSQFTESRRSLDGQLPEMVGTRLSDFFCPQELKSGEFSVSSAQSPNKPVISRAVDVDISPSVSESKCSLIREENGCSSSFIESADKNQAEIVENLTPKERHPSPTRRFSFHLGRMSRSLSFKDNLAVPQLSSGYATVQSGPVRPKTSSGADNCKSDQASGCNRARSSPLRRLLEPLLKPKGAHIAETVSTGSKAPSQEPRPKRPTTLVVLLQLTLKNGLPFFKLVVNNNNDMLAATVKRLPASERSDSCMMYVFYSIHEIKKKGMSWMNQGSKSKSCNLGYNVVGKMKISGYDECNSRQCILYGVDRGQANEQALKNEPKKELAAVIVRNSSKMEHEETKNSSGTVVILPAGVHTLPIEGTHSSLISRWRFGGSCDCGGWDVGCKLRVLVDSRKSSHGPQTSERSSSIDQINLFVEGGEKENKPVFMMKPFSNGYYSIELDASISLLEAFATCVAHITCLKFPEITDAKSPGLQHVAEAIAEANKSRTPTTFQDQPPAYITCPPLSPAGRI